MLSKPHQEALLKFAKHPRPFELLNIDPSWKNFEQLYRELNDRAQKEFLEHCYRSKKSFSFADFRETEFFMRYCFLRRHLDKLSSWLYEKHEMPPELLEARMGQPCYDNPWGLKARPGKKMVDLSSSFNRKRRGFDLN